MVVESEFAEIVNSNTKVVRVVRKKDNIPVALKFTHLEEGFVDSYLSSFEKLGKVVHPNIIEHKAIYTLDRIDFTYSVVEVLEYANQGPLCSFLKTPHKFSHIVELFKQALTGYHFLHSSGFLHRDIKATNILVHQNQHGIFAKISDIEFWQPNGTMGSIKSTPEYLAPEVKTYSDYTVQAEIWAIGVMLYELFTGEFPFGSRLNGDSVSQIRDNSRIIAPEFIDKIPPPFRVLVAKCLVKNTDQRLKSVNKMLRMLRPTAILVDILKSKIFSLKA